MSSGELPFVSAFARTETPLSLGSRAVGADFARVQDVDGAAPRQDTLARQEPVGPVGGCTRRTAASLPSSVIHELRTPLTSIHGYAQVLQRTLRDEPRATSALGVIVRESGRLTAMLAALSELAELDSDDALVEPTRIDVRPVVDEVVQEVAKRDAGQHPIQVEGDATAHCDPRRLAQALAPILTNATLYSQPGTPVVVTICRDQHRVEISISDEGIGIEPADRARVFERFERGSNARQAGVRGLGLGLYLTRAALGLMDGSVSHEPRPGGGTIFRVAVPGA